MPLMETVHTVTDSLPGGSTRQENRAVINDAKRQARDVRATAAATEISRRPWITRFKYGAIGALVLGTAYFMHSNGTDKELGRAAGQTAGLGVDGSVGVGSAVWNVGGGFIGGGVEQIRQEASDRNFRVQSPIGSGEQTGADENSTPSVPIENETPAPTVTAPPTPSPLGEISPIVDFVPAEAGDSAWSLSRKCLGETQENPLPDVIVKQYADIVFIPANGDDIQPGQLYSC